MSASKPEQPLFLLARLIGDKWSVQVIVTLLAGKTRYLEIQRHIPGISRKVLTATLRKLEQYDLVKRVVYEVAPPHTEYYLTDAGYSMMEVLFEGCHWSRKHFAKYYEALAPLPSECKKPALP